METTKGLGLARCPFCHEDVRFERESWLACAGCLARHHAACWDEAGACAACGDPRALAVPRNRRVRISLLAGAAVVALTVAAQVVTALLLTVRFDRELADRASTDADARQAIDRVDAASLRLERSSERADAQLTHLATDAADAARAVSNAKMNTEECAREIEIAKARADELMRTVRFLRIPLEPGTARTRAEAIDTLVDLGACGELTESEVRRASYGVIWGRVSPQNVSEFKRLAVGVRDGTVSILPRFFEQEKTRLLDF